MAGPVVLAIVAGSSCRDPDSLSPATPPADAPSAKAIVTSLPEPSIAPLIFSLGLPRVPPGTQSKPDRRWTGSNARVELDETFVFELGMGGGPEGMNVSTIAASGRASHVYRKDVVRDRGHAWRRVDFRVTQEELDELVRVLNDEAFLQLPWEYDAPGVHDGATWILHVRTRAREKYVTLHNAFPTPVVRIARFVTEGLIDKRTDLGERSRIVPMSAEEPLWRWRDWHQGCQLGVNPVNDDRGCIPLGVRVQLRCEAPRDLPARYEATLVDTTAGGRALERCEGTLRREAREGTVYLNVPYDRIDVRHRYEVRARMTAGEAEWEAAPHAVVTYGEPHAVEMGLARKD
jgi:hypothetical protein